MNKEPIKGKVLQASSKRLAGRTIVVGNTNFSFDKNGICTNKPNGRASRGADFITLCKMHGVADISEQTTELAFEQEQPASPLTVAEEKFVEEFMEENKELMQSLASQEAEQAVESVPEGHIDSQIKWLENTEKKRAKRTKKENE